VLGEPEVGRPDDPPLGHAPDRLEPLAPRDACLDFDEGDEPPALDDKVDFAERRPVTTGE
jgi:hypothetical protein